MTYLPPAGQRRRHTSPLRYPGGKGKLANFFKLIFLENGLTGCRYIEPFAGGGSLALSLLYEEFAHTIHINDIDEGIFAFWKSVLDYTDEFCKRIDDLDVTTDEWERQRRIQRAPNPNILDLAVSTFFLNRANRSGIIMGGIIGGKKQQGAWKIDARFNKADLLRRIRKVARYRNRINLSCMDAVELIASLPNGTDLAKSFVYLDPPYYVKGEGLYRNFYNHSDHADLAKLVAGLRCPWIVTYDKQPEIESLYEDWPSLKYDLSYSAARRYSGGEIMFTSADLMLPDLDSPANVPAQVLDQTRLAYFGSNPER